MTGLVLKTMLAMFVGSFIMTLLIMLYVLVVGDPSLGQGVPFTFRSK